LEEKGMLEHARFWADCEEYNKLSLKRTMQKKTDGRARAIYRRYVELPYWEMAGAVDELKQANYKPPRVAVDTAQGHAGEDVARCAAEFKETEAFKQRHQKNRSSKTKGRAVGRVLGGGGRKSQGHTPLDVSDFMRMIKNPNEYDEFAKHLRSEHDDGLKLTTDLKFWIEIQRYKNLVHLHRCEKLTKQKMRVIVNTFLEPDTGERSGPLPVHVNEDTAKALRSKAASNKVCTAYFFRAAEEVVFNHIFKYHAPFKAALVEKQLGLKDTRKVPIIRRGRQSTVTKGIKGLQHRMSKITFANKFTGDLIKDQRDAKDSVAQGNAPNQRPIMSFSMMTGPMNITPSLRPSLDNDSDY